MAGPDLAGRHVERGKEGGRAVPGIVMAVSGEGAAVLEPEIALRPFQGLDVRLLVDREHESALGRIKIEADDLRGLGDEIGIVALAPGLPPVEVDLLGPQEAPDILVADVAQSLGDEPARPAGIALRRRPPQHRQNARSVVSSYLAEARPPGRGRSSRPDSPSSAKRMRQWLTVRGIVPRSRAIARVDKPSAAISTIRARNTCRCSLVGARSRASSSARSSGKSRTSLASGNMPHDES